MTPNPQSVDRSKIRYVTIGGAVAGDADKKASDPRYREVEL